MKKLLSSLLVFAGIILTPAFASASPYTPASSVGINDLAYSYFAYGAPYIQNVASVRQQAKALNSGYFGGYGYTPAGYSYYSPYTQNYNYSGVAPIVPYNSYGNYGYSNGYNGYSNYFYPNNYSYGYSNPYQSILGTNNSTYMSFYWIKPITPYQNSTNSSVDVNRSQEQSTLDSSLNNRFGYMNSTPSNSWGSSFSTTPGNNSAFPQNNDWSSTFQFNDNSSVTPESGWNSSFNMGGSQNNSATSGDWGSTFSNGSTMQPQQNTMPMEDGYTSTFKMN